MTLDALRLWFSSRGFEVTAVQTERDARRAVRCSPPDALLTDWSLGDDGSTAESTIRDIRRRSRETPVIVLTGAAQEEVLANLAPDALPTRILEKPVPARELERLLVDALDRARQTHDR